MLSWPPFPGAGPNSTVPCAPSQGGMKPGFAPIHPIAWKGYSPNFACRVFSEIRQRTPETGWFALANAALKRVLHLLLVLATVAVIADVVELISPPLGKECRVRRFILLRAGSA